VISKIPGMKQLSNKKSTSYYLKKSSEFFPELYNFYPKTYTLPDDFKEFQSAFKESSSKIYIAKPDKGTQGLGIFIVTSIA
jgi:tubulin polyglutamylase TTLL11